MHNPKTVDLLVSLAFAAACEGALDDFPIGLGLRVALPVTVPANYNDPPAPAPVSAVSVGGMLVPPLPPAKHQVVTAVVAPRTPYSGPLGSDGLVDFDHLNRPQVCSPGSPK